MIENYSKDVAGNMYFSLHGVNYRIFSGIMHIFTQQEVFSLVRISADDKGNFDPFTGRKGIESQRNILSYCQHLDGDKIHDLTEDYQKQFFSSKSFKEKVSKVKGLRPHVYTGLLSILVQELIQNEGFIEKKNTKKKSQAKELADTSKTASTRKPLKKTLKR